MQLEPGAQGRMNYKPYGTLDTSSCCIIIFLRVGEYICRNNLLHSSRRLRQTISAPDFVELFGKGEPHSKGKRQNVFGAEDELKVAPKGVDKTHK